MSEWDRLEAEERARRAAGIPDGSDDGRPTPPLTAYQDNIVPIREDIDPQRQVESIALIDPSSWTGTEAPERRWIVKDYIPRGQATLLTGKGAAGKSLVSQLQCTCIAMGMPFLGVEVEQCVTLYITCEDDADELHRRQNAINASLGITMDDLSGKMFLLSLHGQMGNELAVFAPDGRMSIAPRYEQILAACQAVNVSFLTLDNTAHLFTGNENDRHQVASFINLCNRLAIAIGGSVLIVGHPNKAGDSYSGSTAWENQVRSRLFMEIPVNDNGAIENPDARVMRREKVNYAQAGGELDFVWHKGSFVLPDHVEQHAPDIAATMADTRDNGIFLACLKERNRQQRAVSEQKTSRSYAPKEMAAMPESKDIGRERLERAMDRLFRIGAIERGFLWVHKGEGKNAFGLRISDKKTSSKGSDDIPMTPPMTSGEKSENLTKPNEIKPMTPPMTSAERSSEKKRKTQQNQTDDLSDDIPMTSDDLSDDIPPSLREGYGASPSTGGGGLPRTGDDEPPAWMDQAPPIEPSDYLQDVPQVEFGDWRDNPLLNGRDA